MTAQPSVGVVVPVRNSQKHLGTLLRSLFAQDYGANNFFVVLAGNVGDQTWAAIPPELADDPRLQTIEVELPQTFKGGRDTNFKRNAGALHALGLGAEYLFFTDSKIQHNPNWISYGISRMAKEGVEALAGIMLDVETGEPSFLSVYTDKALIRRNPDFGAGYLLTAANFGRRESLPITATFAMSAEHFRLMDGFDTRFTISYEDYSAAWRLVANGGTIFCTSKWVVRHKHRTQFKQMVLEHWRSGMGAAMLSYYYPQCKYGYRRKVQAFGVIIALLLGLFVSGVTLALQDPLYVMAGVILVGAGLVGAGIANYIKAEVWFSVLFPPLSAFFIFIFACGFMYQYVTRGSGARFLQTNIWNLALG